MRATRKILSAMLFGMGFIAVLNVSAAQGPATPLDLNTASEASLNQLPYVNKPTAKRIVANRPYASVNELSKAGIETTGMLEVIAKFVVQPYSAPAPKAGKGKGGKVKENDDWGTIHGRSLN